MNPGKILPLAITILSLSACLGFSCGRTAAQPQIAATVEGALLEGPAADSSGNVYFSDVPNQRIMKFDSSGKLSVYRESSNGAIGLLLDFQGRLIVCETGGFPKGEGHSKGTPRVTRTNLETGAIEVLVENVDGGPLNAPNDLTVDGKGRIYFTDMGGAAVYRIDTPGKVSRILAAPDVKVPNGIQVSPDDKTLYLVESGRNASDLREIRAFDLLPDGSVENGRTFYKFYPGRSADGISVDVEGNVYASAGIGRLRGTSETLDVKTGVYVISPAGRLLNFIPIPQDLITNNAFGGPSMKTLYVTSGTTLFKIQTEASGLLR